MIGGTVTHLRPSVPSVAVGAEQPQVATVGLPIAQTVVPCSRTTLLQASVDMVNVEHAKIALATVNARSAKFSDERQLPPPVARMLVSFVSVDRPILVPAIVSAKAMLAGLSALLARLSALPSRSQVAVAPAILSGAIFQAIEMRFKWLRAVSAGDFYGALFHGRNIARTQSPPKYFDIACKRIEDAQRQGDFFIDDQAA